MPVVSSLQQGSIEFLSSDKKHLRAKTKVPTVPKVERIRRKGIDSTATQNNRYALQRHHDSLETSRNCIEDKLELHYHDGSEKALWWSI